MNLDIVQKVTDQIIVQLESGVAPWITPWTHAGGGRPYNAATKHVYQGMNAFVLGFVGKQYGDPRWCTFKQAQALKASVRAGEKAAAWIIFYKMLPGRERDDGTMGRPFPFAKMAAVFNAKQIDGLPELPGRAEQVEFDPIAEAEKIYQGMPNRPTVNETEGQDAFYTPTKDAVTLPARKEFVSAEQFYATAFHELAHSTGHSTRLDRHQEEHLLGRFGSAPYSEEELVAEMAAGFLCAEVGIDNVSQNATYVQSWLDALKNDRTMLTKAASRGQKAADYILGVVPPAKAGGRD